METNMQFWEKLDEVIAEHVIVIDRPKGTPHPHDPEVIYPVDYGFLEGTEAMDGGGVDVWVGTTGLARVDGVLCTVDLEKRDVEIKILFSCTEDEMQAIDDLCNQGEMAALLIRR
jgi:inorganic pyrophosphatase